MKKEKKILQEIATSRIVIMLFSVFALAILARLYIMPFQKHSYVFNNYYVIFEYAVMLVTFILSVFGFLRIKSLKTKELNVSNSLFTPYMFEVLAVCAFLAAVLIPLSKNRTLAFKYTVFALIGVFVAYVVYYLVGRSFSVIALLCTAYCILFAYLDFMYSSNVTFSDKISITYPSFIFILIGVIVICFLCLLVVSKKFPDFKIFNTIVVSLIAIIALIVRLFVLKYVSLIAIILEVLVFVFLAINTKYKFMNKK